MDENVFFCAVDSDVGGLNANQFEVGNSLNAVNEVYLKNICILQLTPKLNLLLNYIQVSARVVFNLVLELIRIARIQ